MPEKSTDGKPEIACLFAAIASIIPDVSKVGISRPSIAPNRDSMPERSILGTFIPCLTLSVIAS